MRRMRKTGTDIEINVIEHIMTKNFWEYYITDEGTSDIVLALVMGYEIELGDVSLAEIKPHIINRVKVNKELELFPASGWEWVA